MKITQRDERPTPTMAEDAPRIDDDDAERAVDGWAEYRPRTRAAGDWSRYTVPWATRAAIVAMVEQRQIEGRD